MRLVDTLERPVAAAQGGSDQQVDGAAMLDATLSQRRGAAEHVQPSEASGTRGEPF